MLSAERLQSRIDELAAAVDTDYAGENLLVVCVLKGSYIFTADLTRRLTIPHEIDFIAVSSYGDGVTSSGNVVVTQDLQRDIRDRHVLLVEDIVDTGATIRFLVTTCQERGAASVRIISLLMKEGTDEENLPDVEYLGFTIPPVFVVGYGLDYAERFRHLPYVATLSGLQESGEI
ncbi:hypoxanthine phosphoribosyltransferase [Gemmatimonadota bacterium]